MNPVQQNPTEVAHRDLTNILLNGRILVNGMPLTGNELSVVVQGEQMLYAKATQLDKANALVAAKKTVKEKTPKNCPAVQFFLNKSINLPGIFEVWSHNGKTNQVRLEFDHFI